MNFSTVEQNNGSLVDMFGTFVEIGGVQYTQNQKEKSVCKIADDSGVTHTVHLHKGNGQLPQPNMLQQRHAFSLKTYQGNYQGKPYTGYSGFWKDRIQVNQPSQPQQSTPPQPQQGSQQATGATNNDDMVRIRSDALKYAKDLVVAEKVIDTHLQATANEFTAFIQTGVWLNKQLLSANQQSSWPEPSGVDGPQDIDERPVTDADVPADNIPF